MTVVDSRGRRVPADQRGREFSGPPKGSRKRPAAKRTAPAAESDATEVRATGRRPGALALWTFAVAGCAVGVFVGAAQQEMSYRSASIAYVVVAPITAGLVRRGRGLMLLTFCLPLVFVIAISAAAAFVLEQDSFPITSRGVLQEVGQQLVLHPFALWGGTALAVIVAIRRGMGRRHR